jgi:hypothetical protein
MSSNVVFYDVEQLVARDVLDYQFSSAPSPPFMPLPTLPRVKLIERRSFFVAQGIVRFVVLKGFRVIFFSLLDLF